MGVTEFGRTPVSQGTGKTAGSDHHPGCFTCWMAGAGLKPGFAYGVSDELGYKPAENEVAGSEFDGAPLHLAGAGHGELTCFRNRPPRSVFALPRRPVRGNLATLIRQHYDPL